MENDTRVEKENSVSDPQTTNKHVMVDKLGFDADTGDSWIYPSNLPCRSYQLNIAEASLYNNTLVVLPTGLGKTLIAAVVMYNFYRWYPTAKIIFMAPTRPLVTQQIEACQCVMPFPNCDTIEITGKLQRSRRIEFWRTKRVFFATPQVVQSDIICSLGITADGELNKTMSGEDPEPSDFPFDDIRLVVVDEAHKARGRYAYTEVVQAIGQRNKDFRVLALSATPGRSMEDVAEVVRNLFISRLEIRFDNSIDVAPFVHTRNMKTIVVPLGENIREIHEEMSRIIDPYLRQLNDARILNTSTVNNPTRNNLLFEQKRFREATLRQRHPQAGNINSNFSICISLFHALELLERHGTRVFLNYFELDDNGRDKFIFNIDRKLRELVERLRVEIGPNPFEVSAHAMTNGEMVEIAIDLDFGHPKFEKTRECILQHFQNFPESRAIVFCEYRESVMLMYRMLLQHKSVLRPRCLIGQSGGPLRALTQKQQVEIMNNFREGTVNILIATCIGEEGIDVGEVDLIVCFDINTSNPTRFVQRIGRTGRQRQGSVIMLVTEGKEQQMMREVLSQKDQTNRRIINSNVVKSALYCSAPRLVPVELKPRCVHTFITKPKEDIIEKKVATKSEKVSKRKGKTKVMSPIKGTQDLRVFFQGGKSKAAKSTAIKCDLFENDGHSQEQALLSKRPDNDKSMSRINRLCADVQASLQLPSLTQLLATQSNLESATLKAKTYCKNNMESVDTLSSDNLEKYAPSSSLTARFRRINKFLQNPKSNYPPSKWITNINDQLHSKTFSNEGKKIILKQQPSIIRESLEKIRILEALRVIAVENEEMSIEERATRELYDIIEKACGGTRESVEDFLYSVELQWEKHTSMSFDPWEGLNETVQEDPDSFNRLMNVIFKDLEGGEGRIWRDNTKYIDEEFARIESEIDPIDEMLQKKGLYKPPEPPDVYESMIYNTIDNNWSDDLTMDESKYSIQINENTDSSGKQNSISVSSMKTPKQMCVELEDDDDAILVLTSESVDPSPVSASQEKPTYAELDDDDHCLVLACEQAELSPSISRRKTPISRVNELISHKVQPDSQQQELEGFDLATFMDDPFSEEFQEQISRNKYTPSPCDGLTDKNVSGKIYQGTPDLFETTRVESGAPLPSTTAPYILAQSTSTPKQQPQLSIPDFLVNRSSTPHTHNTKSLPTSSAFAMPSPLISPKRQTVVQITQKGSPSIFDLYVRHNSSNQVRTPNSPRAERKRSVDPIVHSQRPDFSVIGRKTSYPKRRIIESDSDDDFENDLRRTCKEPVPLEEIGSETDCDEFVEKVQLSKKRCLSNRPKKQRLNAFIEVEANVSYAGESADEIECTQDEYAANSMLKNSGEISDDENAVSKTQMEAIYLQSLKSPQQRLGAFKIPSKRIYNDTANIYSQPVHTEPSQYVLDSFTVDEEPKADTSLCPLERAERILKERRRARKHQYQPNHVESLPKLGRIRRVVLPVDDDSD